jgi:hypothetical protein
MHSLACTGCAVTSTVRSRSAIDGAAGDARTHAIEEVIAVCEARGMRNAESFSEGCGPKPIYSQVDWTTPAGPQADAARTGAARHKPGYRANALWTGGLVELQCGADAHDAARRLRSEALAIACDRGMRPLEAKVLRCHTGRRMSTKSCGFCEGSLG